jgi:atypical dual specificity phosphatase
VLASAGCRESEPEEVESMATTTVPPGEPTAVAQPAVVPEEPRRFSWLEDGVLAGLAYPGTGDEARATLAWLNGHGVRLLVSLTEEPLDPALVAGAHLEGAHIPVVDFTAPTIEQLDQFVALVESAKADGRPVAVHCAGGLGRTGTFLASWLVAKGAPADEAIAEVRELRPGSIETADQEQILRDFEAHLNPEK